MTVTYYGHSVLQIETDGTTLLFDPFISDNPHCEGVATPDDVSPDVLLLTHAHFDHYGDTEAIVRRAAPLVVGPLEVVNYVTERTGHEDVHPMNAGGAWSFEWGRVTNTYARHSSSFPDGTYGGLASGFLLEIQGKTVYNTGDTCRFAEMAWLGEQHDIDLLFLPIGDDFTMGPDEALRAVEMLDPALVVPIHYNTFPLIETDPEAFAARVRESGRQARVLDAGESIEV
jgi:L-ascorbate metabolism protein UlaG (beta-lactamase superfamily)